ncbi:MAG: IMP cyclohydrolase [Oscillospiraceae bacterium]|nr:IMP cyclohydrolase [Oscillospiraceae bacterium]
MICNINELLQGNAYPGRGIIIGCSGDGKRSVIVYFIMGRSENSRNRVFEKTNDGIRTVAFDESKMTDPSLIIYHPVRESEFGVIVTNGDQTDTILKSQSSGSCFTSALRTREFEPDAPVYTPRISGLIEQNGSYKLSILKTSAGNPKFCQRNFYEYSGLIPGLGHFISTYKNDGDPPPSFYGDPVPVEITDSSGFEVFANDIWESLDANNKVSLYARASDLTTGEVSDFIINKLKA